MTHERHPNRSSDRRDIYQTVLQGLLSSQWSDWFEVFAITLDERGQTILVGPVIDQAALHGLLKKIRDSGILLICDKIADDIVSRIDDDF